MTLLTNKDQFGASKTIISLVAVFGVACSSGQIAPVETTRNGPALQKTRRLDLTEELFDVQVADPYRWLEDEEADEVKKWMAERDRHARTHLNALPERDAIAARLKALIYVESRSAPTKRGKRLFFSKKPADREKSVFYWQEGEKGEPKVLLDPNTMSEDGSVSVKTVVATYDGKTVAYLEKANNKDESTLRVMDVESLEVSKVDVIEGLRYTHPSWTPDGTGFYYTRFPNDPKIPVNERMGHAEVRYHQLGTDPKTDITVREKTGDPQRWQGAWVSRDGKFLFLSIRRGWAEEDIYVRLLDEKEPKWKKLTVGTKALYMVTAWKGVIYVASNGEAPRWRIFRVDPSRLDKKHWKEIVPEDSKAVLDGMSVIGEHLALTYLKNASTELQVRTLKGKLVRKVKLPGIGTSSALQGNEDEDTAYFTFSSFTYPQEVYKTSIKSGTTELFAKVEVPVKPDDFTVKQDWYTSKDGTKVSIFLVHRKDVEPNGKNPTLLYGYGGFNIPLTPRFSSLIYPWIERGGVYAVPNLRGGGEYGEEWHQAGMLANKQNVFDDFIAAGQWLVEKGYTNPERLAIAGRSNGGLLVGAAMTQRPDLFRAVVCGVPLLDMLRYHRFGIGKAWIPEYGSPEIADQFKVLAAYSPYHNVKPETEYPALLMLSADSDDRVDPMHARKFVAAIEAASTGRHRNLLRIESKSGHGGADMRKKYVERVADEIAFLLSELTTKP